MSRKLNLARQMREVILCYRSGIAPDSDNLHLTRKGLINRGLIRADGSLTTEGERIAKKIVAGECPK